MRAGWGVDVLRISQTFVTSALDGREWPASRSCRFTPEEGYPGTHSVEAWMDPRAGVDAMGIRKILPLSGIEPRPSSP
jgi:hypothetical protein